MYRLAIASLLVVGMWVVPSRADACGCRMKQCGQPNARNATVDSVPAADKPAEKCKCSGPNDCNCEKGKCGCKSCGPKKVGTFFELKTGSRVVVARDASAGLRI